ncbi:MAG: L,D-transpeptidase family protein [Syntrophales bacterium]|nr:L,D-transpeptidase family protein [Syntrophales bacterium]
MDAKECHFNESPRIQDTVFGDFQIHRVANKDTLLEIARSYGLGFNDIRLLYPDVDPWIPEEGLLLLIPTQWILPRSKHNIVINIPEMRMYMSEPGKKTVKTYPVGIGSEEWETPPGIARVISKIENPAWTVPLSIRHNYPRAQIPPGPDNPLGKYWIGLDKEGVGIHGTNIPWSVGRMLSHGCIRLYPEDIERFYEEISVGATVDILYEPIKLGLKEGKIYMEAHPDIYEKIKDYGSYVFSLLKKSDCLQYVSLKKVQKVMKEKKGIPVCIGDIENPIIAGRFRSLKSRMQ